MGRDGVSSLRRWPLEAARWAWQPSAPAPGELRWVDVRDLGVIGDGRTNDTRAPQRAIDLANDQGGGVMQFSAGTWLGVDPTGVQGLFGVARR